ncbi:hypothetical protein KPG71_18875 [Roseovarius sp. PS-C2]|uniref:hypothetical protein n=1 Tax=Roseovarius sp. PS-C2 TaxID=2820814 RepID=UPI001C0CF43A|nr:hypothetical protein [Roseovarius sp. PS-C2]MBU3262090.1 hypothetical protein [Roseovarius sp. PS-C2]
MMTVSDICTAIGRKEIERALDVSKAAISNAVANGKFPPGWFDVIEAECARRGIPCDRNLFAFKRASEASEDAA